MPSSQNAPPLHSHPLGSRELHIIDRVAAKPMVAVLLVAADLLWVLFSAVVGFPTELETIFHTVAVAVTLAMVFVIQHTQSRQEAATQRKLDEILQALPHADNALIAVEDASADTLTAHHTAHRDLRREAVDHR